MNTIRLNIIGDSPVVVKKGSQVQSQEKTVEITENGTTEVVPDAGYALLKVTVNTNVESSGGSVTKWTGHADAEGLKAIGWTDEDIAYYQANGVNWNEEEDEYHKVTDDNKALYGVLTADNISTYKDRIVYLPKIDTSGKTSMVQMFLKCYSLVAIPLLDTSSVTSMSQMFDNCYSLKSIPLLDTSSVKNMNQMFDNCHSLISIPWLDTSSATGVDYTFYMCYSLTYAYIKGVKLDLSFSLSYLLSKDSLLYIINNEAATSAITITLAAYAYTRLAEDADIVAALANHPNISLASA